MQEIFSKLTPTHKTLLIIALFTLLGALTLLIKNTAENYQYERAKLYNTAIQASTTASFNYAVDSQQGNIITYGTFTTPNPVTHPDVHNSYFSITKVQQEYTQHTEYYECGTEENPQTCTRTYYTWDYDGQESNRADTLTLHERQYPADIFSIPYSRYLKCNDIKLECKSGYVYEDNDWFASEGDIRWYYYVTDHTFSGSIIINTMYGKFAALDGNKITIQNTTIEEMIQDANDTTSINFFIIFLFIINLGICIILFKENVYETTYRNY